MDLRRYLTREGNPLPEGTLVVGGGLIVNGLATFAFLSIAGRVLGPEDFAPLGVLWALVFFAGPGLFLPLEQEVSRALANRWARNLGVGTLVRQAAVIGGVTCGVVGAIALVVWPFVLDDLLRGDVALFVAFVVGTAGYAAVHLTRGVLAGEGRFRGYARLFVGEGVPRVVLAAILAVVGVELAGAYGALVALAPFLGVLLGLRGEHDLVTEGPEAEWGELLAAMGSLLVASLSAAFLLNAGTLAVEYLATPSQEEEAGIFLAALVVARVPLFLFQAVQATLLPKLSALAGAGRFHEFRSRLGRLLAVVGAIAVVGTVGAAIIGPTVVHLMFGEEYSVGGPDLAMLALAMGLFMVAVSLGQALIALSGQAWVAVGWATGAVLFVVATALGNDLFFRVEVGLLVGSGSAALVLGAIGWVRLHSHLRAMPHTLTPLDHPGDVVSVESEEECQGTDDATA